MSLNWQYATERGVTIVTLTGHLGGESLARFTGAVSWLLGHGTGPILVDLTRLFSWSAEGEATVMDAARSLGPARQPLALCGIGELPTSLIAATSLPPACYADREAAMTALAVRLGEQPKTSDGCS
ncbi:STAS domain-containing protein [Streptomyces celluloflavus]|uniref:anti-sigma factor antagonist n=1 Tax=Streptomyces celluloflavus TaxID=58344 RepID=UPI00345FC1A0|nr:anti-sigma factor antagonist [Streptomyces celluloflavus]